MDRLLKPRVFETDPNAPDAAKQWKYFYRCFQNFLTEVEGDGNRLKLLINHISPDIYTFIDECQTYDQAIRDLKKIYVKTPNTVFARHLLATRRQQDGESLDSFLQALKDLSKDCNFTAVTADVHRDEYIRDSFITNIQSNQIRTRLLENIQLDLDTMSAQARSLDSAQKSAVSFQSQHFKVQSAAASYDFRSQNQTKRQSPNYHYQEQSSRSSSYNAPSSDTCDFCGFEAHPRPKCPARDSTCGKCKRKGHWTRMCRSKPFTNQRSAAAATNTISQPNHEDHTSDSENHQEPYMPVKLPWLSSILAITNPRPNTCIIPVKLGRKEYDYDALADSGSDLSFVKAKVVSDRSLRVFPSNNEISMADTSLSTKVMGYCTENLTVAGRFYPNVKLMVLPGLCSDIILGQDFQALHESVTVKYGGNHPPLVLGSANSSSSQSNPSTPPASSDHILSLLAALGTMNIDPPALFPNLHPNITPIATKSRKYSSDDSKFIEQEVQRLLSEGIIEKSTSPWRAQCVVVTREGSSKKRLAIDYSDTINKYTYLDAYPVPNITDIVNTIATYRHYSTIDMRSAYHQIEIREEDRPFTAFEANGGLYQFRRLPFGVTNGVACFQREMDRFISDNSLKATYAYLDNITICGKDKADHDVNLLKFMEAAKEANLTYNNDKCEFSTTSLKILGSIVEDGTIKPDLDRLKPLLELSPPQNIKQFRRTMGFFAHYSKYISNFSAKLRPLSQTTAFPLSSEAVAAFNSLKEDIKNSVMGAVDISVPFILETDASDHTIAAVLNQSGRPVAFFSRTLQPSEVKHPSVEKEAQAIIESVRHWRHFLTGAHFTIVTDQKSVSYMFDKEHKGKVKNEKIHRWRMELSCYNFSIEHRPGVQNIPADTFSRNTCAGTVNNQLYDLHDSLCHPGVTRLNHFIKTKNLAYSLDEIRENNKNCQICARNKPRFIVQNNTLIKATQPFERLSVDFKGPLPSTNKNVYLLDIVDEYSRFPWGFPCSDMTASTVIKCFTELFSTYGCPGYIHTDQGSNFMSKELKTFLLQKNIATSRTTPYNPQGNGQIEKFNGTLWKSVTLALQSRGLPQSNWQDVLPDALHSIRSLLCTATNCTPHERLFMFQRRSTNGTSVPTWITQADTALLKRQVRQSKQDPLVDEVDIIEVNPHYATVRLDNGTEKNVSLKHLAPAGVPSHSQVNTPYVDPQAQPVLVNPEAQPVQGTCDVQPAELPCDAPRTAPPAPVPPTPIMGHRGELWCDLTSDNIIQGRRRR